MTDLLFLDRMDWMFLDNGLTSWQAARLAGKITNLQGMLIPSKKFVFVRIDILRE